MRIIAIFGPPSGPEKGLFRVAGNPIPPNVMTHSTLPTKKTALWLGAFLLLAVSSAAQTKPSETLPRLSPRPLSVDGVAACNLSLDGPWRFSAPSIAETSIEVPGEWTMQGFDIPEGETAVYTREFSLPADWNGKRVKIRFDGVSSYARVSVNGQPVGEHEGGMVPFEMDITSAVRTGGNRLQVEVKANTVSDRLGCVSQYAVHTVGGLVRKVSLYALPAVNIASLDAVTTLDKSYKNAELGIACTIADQAGASLGAGRFSVDYLLSDADGKKVASARVAVDGQHRADARLKVNNARLWNPEQPHLYTLTATLVADGKPVQATTRRVGLRQVEVRGNLLLVNGQKVKLHGVNRHETHPLRGRSLTPELCRRDAELFRAGNCNYIRTSHYPPSEEFLDACDELGLFVECEAALTWIEHHASPIWGLWNYEDPKFLPHLVRANLDNVAANRHHPSVIIWSLGNESRWSPLWEEVLVRVKQADPSRPTSFHDQCWGGFNNAGSKADIANFHYPGLNGPRGCDTMSRPTLFGEYAHLSCYNRVELTMDPGVRAAFGKPLVQMYDSMYRHDACLGGALWSGIDDSFHLPGGRIAGYGPWGIIDAWRRPKPEYTGMKRAYSPFKILQSEKTAKGLLLTVENRYDFVNLNKARIEYGASEAAPLKTLIVDIKPRSTGQILLPDGTGYMRVTDPRGFVCAEECFPSETAGAGQSGAGDGSNRVNPLLEDRDDALIVSLGNQRIVIAKTTGLMTAAVDGNVVLSQGPAFCLVPMNWADGGKPNVAGETYQNNIYPGKDYPLYTLFAGSVSGRQTDGGVVVEVDARYKEAAARGKWTYTFADDGRIGVEYEITPASEELSPRQYGVLFRLPRGMETLAWRRAGEFSHYPPDDIARIEGTARLNARPLYEVEEFGKAPEGAWKDDANLLGSVDFRSTKTNLLHARLSDGTNGLAVYGNGKQALRAWLQDGAIHLLVADYNNGGSEPFYGSPFTSGRLTVKKDQTLKGKVVFELK